MIVPNNRQHKEGKMKLRPSLLSIILACLIVFPGVLAADDNQTKWLKKSRLGPYAPATQDWAAIEAAARKEGKVVIFSVSSRIFKIQKDFKEKYGVEIEGYDIHSDEQIEKYTREHKSGLHKTDVLFNNATSTLYGKLLPKKMIWNFVPDTIAALLDDDEKNPFLVQRWSSRVFIYNTALHPAGPPVDNIWDLTRKEWKNKVMSPAATGSAMANTFQTILRRPNEMAAAYEKEFGKPVRLSSGMKNASEEWMLRFMKNAVVIDSTTKIFKGVADVEQKNPPMGITTFSKLRKNKKGVYESSPVYGMEPIFGVGYPTVLVICDQAPHPNAAKLLIRYMMDQGLWPWSVLGDYAARSDMEAQQVKKFNVPPYSKLKIWNADPEYIYDTSYDYMQFAMGLGM